MPWGRRPARRTASSTPVDHVAARGDEDDACPGTVSRLDDPERVVLEHRLLERHRDVLLGLEAGGGRDVLGIVERRQVKRAHDDARIGDADPHALGELVLGEHRLQRLGERVGRVRAWIERGSLSCPGWTSTRAFRR